ncbi:MAG TPA: ABC transporter permease [Acidimicrobiia bacterium]|jgi:spermidine/putrescine transport system permease protein|nr:ABC transporter permease [Acidimicrobiia bacterium]
MAAPAVTPELEAAAERAESRRGFLLAVPGWVYLIIFFAIPLAIVLVFSFASRSATGQTLLEDWNLESYQRLASSLVVEVVFRSLWLAAASTVICLLLGYPFAYYIATRGPTMRNVLLVLVLIPFWSNFLVRTYAWRVLLGSEGPMSQLSQLLGLGETRVLFTTTAVLVGLVYGYLPFMVLPLYAAIERIDWSLVEAGRDLYASGWDAFRRITWPLSRPGVIAGSVLVFVPALGAYVTPEILGGARTTLLGSFVVSQFLAARNWPFGSALSVAILAVMLGATMVYFRTGGRTL